MVSDLLFVGPLGLDLSQNKYKGHYTRQLTLSDKSSILLNVTNEEPFYVILLWWVELTLIDNKDNLPIRKERKEIKIDNNESITLIRVLNTLFKIKKGSNINSHCRLVKSQFYHWFQLILTFYVPFFVLISFTMLVKVQE